MRELLNVRLGSAWEIIDVPSPPLTRNRPSFEKARAFTQDVWPASVLLRG